MINDQEQIGQVDHMLVNRKTNEMPHLVVDTGFYEWSLILPVAMIRRIEDDRIYLAATPDAQRPT